MQVPITQSEVWNKLQHDLGEETFFVQEASYQYLAIYKHTPLGNYLFLPYGPVAEDAKSFKQAIKSIDQLAGKHHAIFTRIEPQLPAATDYLKSLKSARKVKDVDPEHTWVIDLTQSREDLLHGFNQRTRTYFNTFAKKGVTIELTKDPTAIRHLVKFQTELYKTKHLNGFSEDYLRTELSQPFATLYLAKYRDPAVQDPSQTDQVIAATLFFDYAGTRHYMQSASDSAYKKFPATLAIVGTAMLDAKEQGITTFDFWGVAPDDADPSHPWYGFTKFKKSFGGFPRTYAGTYDLVHHPLKYRLYNLLRRLRH